MKDINYIKYININVDIAKIKHIQTWWKYIYKIIILQKNIRKYIIQKKAKHDLRYYKFISSIPKIFYKYFITNIQICYKRNYFQKWKEIKNKKAIINKLRLRKKVLPKEKPLITINNSFQNNIRNDSNRQSTRDNNMKKIVFNNSTLLKDKILSPYRADIEPNKPGNIKINIKKSKKIVCNIYEKNKNNSLNKSLNKSILNKYSSSKRPKSNNKIIAHLDNHSFHFDEKTEDITNNLYKNIKEYYNINEINVNPTGSTINFYPSHIKNKTDKTKIINNLKSKINYNNFTKKTIISNNKNNNRGNFNELYKNNKAESMIPYQHTFGNLKINTNNNRTNNSKNRCNKFIHTAVISPASNSNRNTRRNKNRSLEFDDNDIKSIKLLLKFKKTFLHWKNILIKNKIIKKLRLIVKIKKIILVYKSLYIQLFFAKMTQNIHKNSFYQNKINFNNIILNQYYKTLKDISKKKKLINDIHNKFNKRAKKKEKNNKTKKYENKNKKNNNLNFNTESNASTGLYYATQFNQKFNRLLNDKKGTKNNNIIIINNNINNNCQQLINNVKQNKDKENSNYSFNRKTICNVNNNNSMIDIQPTETSLSCTMDMYNQSDKSLNSIITNHINEKHKQIINKKNKIYYLNRVIALMDDLQRKKMINFYLNRWKIKILIKKCSLPKNKIIDEKIIHFPKSPTPNNIIKNSNLNNFTYNFINGYNNIYNNSIGFDNNNEQNYNTYNNNELIINTMFTDNNLRNTKKNNYGNNNGFLRNKMITPSNKYSFYTQYQNNNENNTFINPLPPRETEPKLIYHKKLFPSYCATNFKQNNNNIQIDFNYNKEDIKNISFNNNMNNINYGKNNLTNFYSSNNFFNQRNNYHLESLDNVLPEEKFGFKKMNKIEEREISFSPSLSRKNLSFKNVIKDNYQNINNNNIYINVVENFRNDFQNQNNNSHLNNIKTKNYENKCYTIKRILTEQDNLQKLMCHSHSQGFGKTIQRIFGNS